MSYAPTNNASQAVKDQFYKRLKKYLARTDAKRTVHLNGRHEYQDCKL